MSSRPPARPVSRFVGPDAIRSSAKAAGAALLAQCLLPWAPGRFFWHRLDSDAWSSVIWGLFGGIALVALGYLDPDRLGRRGSGLVVGAVALLGLVAMSRLAGADLDGGLFLGFPLAAGVSTGVAGLLLWRFRGYTRGAWALVLGAVILLALWWAVPLGGHVPAIYLLGRLGASGIPGGWRFATLLCAVLPFVVGALLLVFVVLPRASASAAWVRRLFACLLVLLPSIFLLLGLGAMRTSAWAQVAFVHHAILAGACIALVPAAVAAVAGLERAGAKTAANEETTDGEPAPAPPPVLPPTAPSSEPARPAEAGAGEEGDDADGGYRKNE